MSETKTTDYASNGPLPLLRILDAQGPQSQRQLAQTLNLTFAGVNFHLKKLQQDHMLKKVSKPATKKRGRPSVAWDINHSQNCTIGIVISPPRMDFNLADFSGNIISCETHKLRKSHSLKKITSMIDDFVSASIAEAKKNKRKIRQVFVGVPGHLEPETGCIIDCPNLPVLADMNFEQHIKSHFGLKTMVQASNYAIYAGEIDRFERDTVGMLITWELGLGILFGCNEDIYNFLGQSGKKYRGLWDLGHNRVIKGGKLCSCGKHGCLEAYTAGWALLQQASKKIDSLEEFISLAKNGNSEVHKVFRTAAKFLGKHVANLIELMGIERIVIAGPLAEIFDLAKDDFNAGLANIIDADDIKKLSPIISTDSQKRTNIGAASVARFVFLYPEIMLDRRKSMAKSQPNTDR